MNRAGRNGRELMLHNTRDTLLLALTIAVVGLAAIIGDTATGTLPGRRASEASVEVEKLGQLPADVLRTAPELNR